jgi:hypothetical protein
MFNIGQYIGWGKATNYENKQAIQIATITQDKLRTQLRDTQLRKPDAYKNSQSSSLRAVVPISYN